VSEKGERAAAMDMAPPLLTLNFESVSRARVDSFCAPSNTKILHPADHAPACFAPCILIACNT